MPTWFRVSVKTRDLASPSLTLPAGKKVAAALLSLGLLSACQSPQMPSDGRTAAEDSASKSATKTAPPGSASPVLSAVEIERAKLQAAQEAENAAKLKTAAATVKIGLLLPFSGPGSEVGPALMDAAAMAMFDLADDRLELMPRDTQGTPEGAAAAAQDVINEGAQIIIGPLLSSSVRAVAPVANNGQVPVVAFSSDRNAAEPGIYLLSFTPHQEIDRIVSYARSQGLLTFAAMLPESAYGHAVEAGIMQAMERHGGELIQVEYYPASGEGVEVAAKQIAQVDARRAALTNRRQELKRLGTKSAKRELRRIKNLQAIGELGIDAIILADGGIQLTRIAPFLQYYDVDFKEVKLLGTGLWYDDTLLREPALKNAWFAAPDPQGFTEFSDRFQSMYGAAPPRIATLAYDAAAMAAILAQQESIDKFAEETLRLSGGFDGKDGVFRFLEDGNADRGLAVLEITDDGFAVRDPAPREFLDQTY